LSLRFLEIQGGDFCSPTAEMPQASQRTRKSGYPVPKGMNWRVSQGLKPAFLLGLSGTAEAVPFPNLAGEGAPATRAMPSAKDKLGDWNMWASGRVRRASLIGEGNSILWQLTLFPKTSGTSFRRKLWFMGKGPRFLCTRPARPGSTKLTRRLGICCAEPVQRGLAPAPLNR
jgi:hypothetical protein